LNYFQYQRFKRTKEKLEEFKSMLIKIVDKIINFKIILNSLSIIFKIKYNQENINIKENKIINHYHS